MRTRALRHFAAILRKSGRRGWFAWETGETYDPETGTVTPGTTYSWPVWVVAEGYSEYYMSNSSLRQGDTKMYISAYQLPVIPNVGDKIYVGSDLETAQQFPINALETSFIGDQRVYYKVFVTGRLI